MFSELEGVFVSGEGEEVLDEAVANVFVEEEGSFLCGFLDNISGGGVNITKKKRE